jgi:hypothetical protein
MSKFAIVASSGGGAAATGARAEDEAAVADHSVTGLPAPHPRCNMAERVSEA